MSEQIEAKGQCLCGSVKLSAKSVSKNAGVCHCSMCRQWTGGPLLAVDCGTEVELEGAEAISTYASSEWAERGFCAKCGSNLFYKIKQTGQYIVPAGVLNIESELTLDHQIFIDEKPSYYCFSNETKNMTGAEVFAQYGG